MEEMHEKRGEYVKRVRGVVAADLLQNGLELETVSLTQLDQTSMEFFDPSNAFDAEGLTRLTEQIERRKKHAQRHRAGHDDPDPQQEPGYRAAGARHRPRARVRAARAGARARGAARDPARPTSRASGRRRSRKPSARRSPRARRSIARASRRSARWTRRASRASSRSRASRSSGGARSTSPSSSARSRSRSSRRRSPRRRRRPTRRARARWPRRSACSPRATPRWRSASKRIDLIARRQEAERDALRLTRRRGGREGRRRPIAARRCAPRRKREADADRIRALAARIRNEVEAEGMRLS